ncbi:hypothetical protein BDV19DRAFT_351982 [Aspergillus venezuelensis]
MPPRRPTSPLKFEPCPPNSSDGDDYPLVASDDELHERQLAARHRRIEKLGEAYLKGQPLFILSASLRGPLEKGWMNPWRKDRRKSGAKERDNESAEPKVIPETNSRKRRQHQLQSNAYRSQSSDTPRKVSRSGSIRDDVSKVFSKHGGARLEPTSSANHSPRFTQHKPGDAQWLKKDKVSTRFQNIDPPTSPTTSISSRHVRGAGSQSSGRPATAGYESAKSSKSQQSKQARQHESSPKPKIAVNAPAAEERRTPGSKLHKHSSQSVNGGGSVHVVSSSSQLPKFEYRLKHGKAFANAGNPPSPKPTEESYGVAGVIGCDESHRNESDEQPISFSAPTNEPQQLEPTTHQTAENSLTLTNASNTIENASSTHPDNDLSHTPKDGTTSENILPSAQHAPRNPAVSDNLTSLYSIAASKATSNRTEDHGADHQFSTQAALMMAQRSFQNDLRSPEYSPASARKRRASQDINRQSPNAANITPFHKMNTPERDLGNRLGNTGTGKPPMISTQYILDAATPFTFSTEKKAEFRTISPEKDRSKTKKRKTTSFAQSSPSEIPSEHFTSDEDDTTNFLQEQPAEAQMSLSTSHQSAFPLTLTGTTPHTAQEGQGTDSFNLSQAIAEAGSWLQQSFDINKDITHCQSAQIPNRPPPDSAH